MADMSASEKIMGAVDETAEVPVGAWRERQERINTLETRLRIWRDDYTRSPDGLTVAIPVYQIENLIGKK